MRLLNVETEQIEDVGQAEVRYAILSHTWLDDEVSFQDITNDPATAKLKKGWRKISFCCQQAINVNLKYVWIDTICIDKSSSAELSEAINSMFQWYKNSCVCYVYLADVSDGVPRRTDTEFGRSRRFKRGWTLQELIAPNALEFYSRNWLPLGSKSTNVHALHLITGIDSQILNGNGQLSQVSIAQRMSWAADRETTRREDAAYCLMGIFDVNMAMLYGEGEKAFIRLQEEIMKDSHDETLFAWTSPGPRVSGLLAPSPKAFKHSAYFTPTPGSLTEHYKTNRGLRLKLFLKKSESHRDVYLAGLSCVEKHPLQINQDGRAVAIFLKRITTSDLPSDVHQYVRISVLNGLDWPGFEG